MGRIEHDHALRMAVQGVGAGGDHNPSGGPGVLPHRKMFEFQLPLNAFIQHKIWVLNIKIYAVRK